jgi:SAM-dependent methyltransferase
VLATGEAAAYRLHILHDLYERGTLRLLLGAGLRRGMRVADVGCGVGMVTALLAQLVGPEGHVVGIDASGAQLAQARERLARLDTNASFVKASAIDTGLPPGSFDLVYCRFLLLHLPDPERALGEMRSLLKPNGILVCEDGDLTSAGSEPPSSLAAFADLWGRLGPKRGLDYTLGRRLFQMVLAAGFAAPEIAFNQPVVARGENKRFLELSVAEAGPAFVNAGLITAEALDRTLAEMRRLTADSTVLAVGNSVLGKGSVRRSRPSLRGASGSSSGEGGSGQRPIVSRQDCSMKNLEETGNTLDRPWLLCQPRGLYCL